MTLLKIDLQEGFVNDTVVISLDGKEVFRSTSVKSRTQIGFAHSMELQIEKDSVIIEISLPLKNISEEISLEVLVPTFLGVSITHEGKIDWQISKEPFGYL